MSQADSVALDELEHQALDRLDELALGPVWTAVQRGREELRPELAAGMRAAGEDPAEVTEALDLARSVFSRLVAGMSERLLLAAEVLARTPERGQLDAEAVAAIRGELGRSPELAPAIAAAVETTGIILGLDRTGLAWAALVDLGERASAAAPDEIRACSEAIGERLAAASPIPLLEPVEPEQPAAGSGGSEPLPPQRPEPTRPLRVFRSAAVAAAGPSVRARFLAADHPEHLGLARALVDELDEPAALVERFDAARAALAAQRPEPAPADEPEQRTDGPKRKFTLGHLIMALIILGLTIWHYVFR